MLLSSQQAGIVASGTPGVALTAPLITQVTTEITTVPTINPLLYNQTVASNGCCQPNVITAQQGINNNNGGCCTPNYSGYNTGAYSQGGVSSCCEPSLSAGATPQLVANNNGCCGPTGLGAPSFSTCCTPTVGNQININSQYNTGSFCSPSTGGISSCCTPTVVAPAVIGTGVGYNSGWCAPSVPGQSSSWCAPSLPGQQTSGCCTPSVPLGGVVTPGYNTTGCCQPSVGTSSNCCTPTLTAPGVVTPGLCGTSSCCTPTVVTPGIVQTSTGCCAPSIPNQSSSWCGPSIGASAGPSSCCTPNLTPVVPSISQPGYNTSGCCAPSVGGSSSCCGPTVSPTGIVTPGLCGNVCGPSLPGQSSSCCAPSLPGQSNGLCAPSLPGQQSSCCAPSLPGQGLCAPSLPGQSSSCCAPSLPGQSSGCCGPSLPVGGTVVQGYNTTGCCGPTVGGSSNCCTPTVVAPGVVSQGACQNVCGPSLPGQSSWCGPSIPQATIINPAYNAYNTGGFCCGPTGISSCCDTNPTSAYLIEDRARVRGGLVTRQVTVIQQIPNRSIVAPIINSTIQPVLTPLITDTTYSSAIVETAVVATQQVNLNPTENLSPEAFTILQTISSQLPISNLGLTFDAPVYLSEKQGVYVGQWVGESMNGYGKLYFDNGGYFEGQFVNGIANTPNGCFIYPDGSYYIGAVSNNFANGQGIYTYKNRTLVYRGNFVNDQPEGRGSEFYADGSRYEGDFRFGRKEGRGVFSWNDGTVYEGQFEGGFMQGYGVHKLSNGQVYDGEFRKNKRHGIGKHISAQGTYNGGFRNDIREGEGRFDWTDGRSFQGTFRDGKPDGPGTLRSSSGKVVNGVWIHGVLDQTSIGSGFGQSQIGSLGALGGNSIIRSGGSLLNTHITGNYTFETTQVATGPTQVLNSAIASTLPVLTTPTTIGIGSNLGGRLSSAVFPAQPVTNLFGSRVPGPVTSFAPIAPIAPIAPVLPVVRPVTPVLPIAPVAPIVPIRSVAPIAPISVSNAGVLPVRGVAPFGVGVGNFAPIGVGNVAPLGVGNLGGVSNFRPSLNLPTPVPVPTASFGGLRPPSSSISSPFIGGSFGALNSNIGNISTSGIPVTTSIRPSTGFTQTTTTTGVTTGFGIPSTSGVGVSGFQPGFATGLNTGINTGVAPATTASFATPGLNTGVTGFNAGIPGYGLNRRI